MFLNVLKTIKLQFVNIFIKFIVYLYLNIYCTFILSYLFMYNNSFMIYYIKISACKNLKLICYKSY